MGGGACRADLTEEGNIDDIWKDWLPSAEHAAHFYLRLRVHFIYNPTGDRTTHRPRWSTSAPFKGGRRSSD